MSGACDFHALLRMANEVRRNSYAPYSGFRVGAALLADSGKVYLGCNVENASYGATCCAERSALFAAISAGERSFWAIALVGGKDDEGDDGVFPCGICRQALCEFCPPDMPVVLKFGNAYKVYALSDLLPKAFTPKDLGLAN